MPADQTIWDVPNVRVDCKGCIDCQTQDPKPIERKKHWPSEHAGLDIGDPRYGLQPSSTHDDFVNVTQRGTRYNESPFCSAITKAGFPCLGGLYDRGYHYQKTESLGDIGACLVVEVCGKHSKMKNVEINSSARRRFSFVGQVWSDWEIRTMISVLTDLTIKDGR